MSPRGCSRPAHADSLCPLHGCAECCVEFVETGFADLDEPPFGPEHDAEGFYVDEEAGYLHEELVDEDGCQICMELVWRAKPLEERHEITCDTHCVDCWACPQTQPICRSCQRCAQHAASHCEQAGQRWSRVTRQREDLWWEDHDFWRAS